MSQSSGLSIKDQLRERADKLEEKRKEQTLLSSQSAADESVEDASGDAADYRQLQSPIHYESQPMRRAMSPLAVEDSSGAQMQDSGIDPMDVPIAVDSANGGCNARCHALPQLLWTRIRNAVVAFHSTVSVASYITATTLLLFILITAVGSIRFCLTSVVYALFSYVLLIVLQQFANARNSAVINGGVIQMGSEQPVAAVSAEALCKEWLFGTLIGVVSYVLHLIVFNLKNELLLGPLLFYSNPQSFVKYTRSEMVASCIWASSILSFIPAALICFRVPSVVRTAANAVNGNAGNQPLVPGAIDGDNRNGNGRLLFATTTALTVSYFGAMDMCGLLISTSGKVAIASTLTMFTLLFLIREVPLCVGLCAVYSTAYFHASHRLLRSLKWRTAFCVLFAAIFAINAAVPSAYANVHFRVDFRTTVMGLSIAVSLLLSVFALLQSHALHTWKFTLSN